MTTMWESSIDIALLFLKVMAFFFLVRLVLMGFDIKFEVPLLDRFLWGVIQYAFENSPRIPGFH